MHRLITLVLTALFCLPLPCASEYAGQGSFSPYVSISGRGCQGITASMNMTCVGSCETSEINLSVQNHSARPVALRVEARVLGRTLLNGGFTETHHIELVPKGSYAGQVIRIFTKADRADVDIAECAGI